MFSYNTDLEYLLCGLKAYKESVKVMHCHLTAHRWHGNSGAGHSGILSFPLRCYSLDLSIKLDALEQETASTVNKIFVLFKFDSKTRTCLP